MAAASVVQRSCIGGWWSSDGTLSVARAASPTSSLNSMFRWTLGAHHDARPGLLSALPIMGALGELRLATPNTCRIGRLVFRTGPSLFALGLPILPMLAVPFGAFWATGLSLDWLVWAAYAYPQSTEDMSVAVC